MRGSWLLFLAIILEASCHTSSLYFHLLNFYLWQLWIKFLSLTIVDSLATVILASPTCWFNSGETPELTHIIPDTLNPLSLPSTSRHLPFKKKYLYYFILRHLPLEKKYLCYYILRHTSLSQTTIRDFFNYIILKIYIGVVAVLPRRASNPGTRE